MWDYLVPTAVQAGKNKVGCSFMEVEDTSYQADYSCCNGFWFWLGWVLGFVCRIINLEFLLSTEKMGGNGLWVSPVPREGQSGQDGGKYGFTTVADTWEEAEYFCLCRV